MWTVDSVEKSLILGKIEGRRRRGFQRVRWLDVLTDAMNMNLGNPREILRDREVCCATVHGVKKSQTWLGNWVTGQQPSLSLSTHTHTHTHTHTIWMRWLDSITFNGHEIGWTPGDGEWQGRPGVRQSMRLEKVRNDLVTEQLPGTLEDNLIFFNFISSFSEKNKFDHRSKERYPWSIV